MSSPLIISLLLSLGVSAWLYSKFARRSGGGNTKPAIIGAAISGLVLFIILYLTLNSVLKK
ncbi:MAG TPA: hypothetical protein VLF90_01650 [Patescibacteria group bacterium]|nr:hypothetical protein [Patescibacteria group bacterium]